MGAYGRFNMILLRAGYLETWYLFEADATEKALRGCCAVNSVEVTGGQTA